MSGNLAVKENYTNFDLMSAIKKTRIAKAFNLKTTTFAVLDCLCDCYNYRNGVVFPSIETLAEEINASEKTASRAIQELIEKRLIIKTKKGKKNIYCFTNIFWDFIKIQADKTNKITRPKQTQNTRQPVQNRGQIVQSIPDNLSGKQNNINKINYKNSNQNFSNFQTQPEGQKYNSVETTKKYLDELTNTKAGSPLDYTKDEAENWLKSLIPSARNTYFAKQLIKKWGFDRCEIFKG